MMPNNYSLKVARAESVIWRSRIHRVPDLYVEVTLNGVTKRTRMIKNNISPIWNDTLTFSLSDESPTFKIELKHSSRLLVDPCVGSIDVELVDLQARCADGEAAFNLLPPSGVSIKPVGSLILHLQAIDTTTSVEINLSDARADIEQRGIVHSAETSDSLASVASEVNRISTHSDLYQAIGGLLSHLEVIKNVIDTVSKVHPFLAIAWQVTSVLYTTVTNVFMTDKRVMGLVRTMRDAFVFVRDVQALRDKVSGLQESIIGLLKQTTECCLFVREYARHGFVGRMLDLTSGTKVDEFEQSFVDLKRAIDSGLTLQTAFVSMRVSKGVDELLLRQRLDPTLMKGFDRSVCLPGTRVEVQQNLIDWLVSDAKQNIFWLYGVAGSGKSTVSTTISEYFRGLSRLGAFLFFEKGKSDPSTVIQTLAYKLALYDFSIGSCITSEVNKDKDIISSSCTSQFDTLLLRPLAAAAPSLPGPIVIVLDALDECGTPQSRRSLMQLLHQGFPKLPNNFRILITSRQEADIVEVLSSLPNSVCSMNLDYTSTTSQCDVLSYLRKEMDGTVRRKVDIPKDWPWDRNIELLGNAAGGLFIWASTAVKLVSNSDNPFRSLKELVADSRVPGRFGLYEMYASVLRNSGIMWSNDGSKERFAKVMGLLLFNKMPMISNTMDMILGFPPEEPSSLILSRLQSVLRYAHGEPVSLFHTSFSDYLMSTERSSDPWFIDKSAQQRFIATRCFEVMEGTLRFNICDLETSFVLNDDVEGLEERVKMNVPPHLEYACLYWAPHLCDTPYSPASLEKLSTFAYQHLLFWFEALSLLKAFGLVANFALRDTIAWLPEHDSDISSFLKDASGLASTFALSISQSTPHIYVSMLPLTKDDSLVATHYSRQISSMVLVKCKGRKIPPRWTKVFEGHTGAVTSVAFSPNGRYVASGSLDCTIRLWDVNTGEATCSPFIGHLGRIWSVSLSPDGTRIVSGSEDKTLRVWNAQNGELVLDPLEGHTDDVWCVTFSPDGTKIVSGSYDNTIRVWGAKNGKLLLEPLVGHSNAVYSVACSPDGRLIVSGSDDKTVLVWDAKTGDIVTGPLVGHSGEVNSVCFSPDEKHFASGSWDGAIKVWEVASGMVVSEIDNGSDNPVHSITFSADGTRIASGSSDKTIIVWDVETTSLVSGPYAGHSDIVTCVAFSPDDMNIVSCSRDTTIRVWDVADKHIDSSPSVGHSSAVLSVAVSSNGGRIVTGSEDETIIIWDALDGTVVLGPLEGHTAAVLSVIFSSDGALIASGSRDRTIRVWDAASGMAVFRPIEGHADCIRSVVFSPDNTLIASGSRDKTIRLWSASNGEFILEPVERHLGAVNCVAFSPDGALLASASDDKAIRIWDVKTVTFISMLEGSTDMITSVAFSPNGRLVVSGSMDGTCIVWDNESGLAIVCDRHDGCVWATIFSTDGEHVIFGRGDKTIMIWSVESRQTVYEPLFGHSDEVTSLSVAPDDGRIFSVSRDKTIRVWDVGNIQQPQSESRIKTDQPRTSSETQALGDWILGDNGWILGGPMRSDLLLWMPPDLRPTLLSPLNTAIFNCPFSTQLDFKDVALGDRWRECFRPLNNI